MRVAGRVPLAPRRCIALIGAAVLLYAAVVVVPRGLAEALGGVEPRGRTSAAAEIGLAAGAGSRQSTAEHGRAGVGRLSAREGDAGERGLSRGSCSSSASLAARSGVTLRARSRRRSPMRARRARR